MNESSNNPVLTAAIEQTTGHASEQFDNLVVHVVELIEAGEEVAIDKVTADYPQLKGKLEQLLPTLQAMASLGHSLLSHEYKPTISTVSQTGVLGDFRILQEIGRGGMGVVYEAEQISLGRRVALKVLPYAARLDTRQLARFKNEARAAATLDHPNIVAVHAVGSERSVHFYAMQLVEGNSLAEVIADLRARQPAKLRNEKNLQSDNDPDAAVPQAEADTEPIAAAATVPETGTHEYFRMVARLGAQAAEALDFAHENGILHRDVKPGNLLIDSDAKLWVTDFGLARIEADPGMTMTGDFLGTLPYMSPEQARGKRAVVDQRTDVYSLGATLYEMLTLSPPFAGTDHQELLQQITCTEPPSARQLARQLPVDLERIVAKAMEKDLADRYATAGELAQDLQAFLEHRPISAKEPSVTARVRKFVKRRPTLAAAASVFVLITVLTGGILWRLHERSIEHLISSANESIAAAQAFFDTEHYRVAQQRLEAALNELEDAGQSTDATLREVRSLLDAAKKKADAAEALDRFRSLREVVLSDFPGWRGNHRTRKACRESLEIYGLLRGEVLDDHPLLLELASPEQLYLKDTIAEHLYLLSRFEVLAVQPSGDPLVRDSGKRRALDALKRLDELAGPMHASLLWQAALRGELGEQRLASAAENRAAMVEPESALDYFALGQHQIEHGQPRKAVRSSFNTALHQDPKHFLSLVYLSDEELYEGNYAVAEALLTGCIAIYPHYYYVWQFRGDTRSTQGKYERAITDYEKSGELRYHLIGHHHGLIAGVYGKMGQTKAALKHLNLTIKKDGHGHWTLSRGTVHRMLGNYDLAIADYNQALRRQRTTNRHDKDYDLFCHVGRAFAYAYLGETEKAKLDIDAAIEIDSDTGLSNEKIAWFLATSPLEELRNYPRALVLATKAVELENRSQPFTQGPSGTWRTLGVAQYRNGEWTNAVSSLDKSLGESAALPEEVMTRYYLAMALHQSGDEEKAVEQFQRAQQADGQLDHVSEPLRALHQEAAGIVGIDSPE